MHRAIRLALLSAVVLVALGASASTGFPYGSNCQGSCGIGSNIITASIQCHLVDTSGNDLANQCGTSISDYNPATLPTNLDPTAISFRWNTTLAASGCVVGGSILNTSDRTVCENSGGNYVISTSHHVVVHHVIPAASNGTGGGSMTYYLASSVDGSSANPGGTTLGPNYGNGWSSWPGPQCVASGRACYFNVYTPNPVAALPIQWELTSPGHLNAFRGHPTALPLYLLWKNGNATTTQGTAGLGSCGAGQLNEVGHLYNTASTPYSAPNSGTWYTCNGTAWTQNQTAPIWVMTSATVTRGGDTYTCGANANGGHDPTTRVPTGTCTGTAGDSKIALIPYYAGIYPNNSATDYRQIGFIGGKYTCDMNCAAPPLNANPTSVLEVYPAADSITGSITVSATFALYTNALGTTPATGTNPVTLTYTMTVGDPTPVAQSTPTPSVDTNLPKYWAFNATASINMCSNASFNTSLDWWNRTISTYMWFPFGAATFGESQTWNYDPQRSFTSASDLFTLKMDGTAWPDFATSTSYGTAYANMEVTPSDDPNGNTWLASVAGTSGGSRPTWTSAATPGQTLTSGSVTFLNVGKKSYWNRCAKNSGEPYMNNVLLTGGGVSQFSQFAGGLDKSRQRTGDAIAKSGGVTTGLYSTAEKVMINGVYGGGTFNVFSTNAGRGAAYQLDSWATYWRTVCSQGRCSDFTGNDAFKREAWWSLNNTINYGYFFANQPEFSTNESLAYGPVIIPFYIGLGMEAAIEWADTCHELDPGNTTGLCNDNRILPYLKNTTGFMHQNWWDNTYKAGEGVHNYSFSYDPRDVQNHTIQEPFYTELTGMDQPAWDFMYAYCGNDTTNCKLPDGTAYDVAADQIRMHQYDGRNCNNWTCTGGSHYSGHPWEGGVGTPKQFGQSNKWGLGNSYYWRYGYSDYLTTDLTPARNPCWDSGTVPCSGTHAYADTLGPYPIQIINPGSSGQDDPGAEGHFTGRTYSPVQNVTANAALIQFWTYEVTAASSVRYGTGSTCNVGVVSTEDAGYPQTRSLAAVTTYLHHFTLTGLAPNTTYYVQLSGTDAAGNAAPNSCAPQSFPGGGINFTTLNQTVLGILTDILPAGSTGTAYSATLQASGGTPPYTWSLTVGALPAGLGLNASTGAITGTPTLAGTSNFTVRVTDNVGAHADKPLSIVIADLQITTTSLPAGTSGVAYSANLAASGGVLPYSWSVKLGAMPPGLVLNSATGAITGTPTRCGSFPATYQVRDGNGLLAFSPLITIVISGCSGVTVTTTSLPNGIINVAYPPQTLQATGGTGPYTWAITAGSLPTGLSLDGATGIISGIATVTGEADFTVQATDTLSAQGSAPLSITIISTAQNGVRLSGTVKQSGNVTTGMPPPPPANELQ